MRQKRTPQRADYANRLPATKRDAAATHVHLEDGFVYRIDELTLEQARRVIVQLIDDLEIERKKRSPGDGFRR